MSTLRFPYKLCTQKIPTHKLYLLHMYTTRMLLQEADWQTITHEFSFKGTLAYSLLLLFIPFATEEAIP